MSEEIAAQVLIARAPRVALIKGECSIRALLGSVLQSDHRAVMVEGELVGRVLQKLVVLVTRTLFW